METNDEGVTDGGQNGPSGSVCDEPDAMLAFARHLGERLMTLRGGLTPQAEIHLALFNDEERAKIVSEFVAAVTPDGVSPAVWMRWLSGGPGPFASGAIKKPVALKQGLGKTVARGPTSIRTARDKVERARAELAQAERELEYTEALNKGLLQYSVTDHLVEVLSGIFAMGPAWTIMRSVSAHLSDEAAEDATFFMGGAARDEAVAKLREGRKIETELMLRILDLGSGVTQFEEELRAAVLKVCKDYEGKQEVLVADGRKARGAERLRACVHPKADVDSTEVLEGLKKAS